MSTSPTTELFDSTSVEKISLGTFAYIRARNRQRIHDMVIRAFKKSGITQADLARRLGKAPEVVNRLLARPRNWEIDTASDLLFAICGAALKFDLLFPAAKQSAGSNWIVVAPVKEPARSTGGIKELPIFAELKKAA